MEAHSDEFGYLVAMFVLCVFFLKEGGQHEGHAGQVVGLVEEAYFSELKVVPDMPVVLEGLGVDVEGPSFLFFGEVNVIYIYGVFVSAPQQDSKEFGLEDAVDGSCSDDDFGCMCILLGSDSESGSHAAVALSVGQVFLAVFINEVVFSGQRRHALLARFFVLAVLGQGLQVVSEEAVAHQVLTLFALFVVGVFAGL